MSTDMCRAFLTAARAVARQEGRPTDVGYAVLGEPRWFFVEQPWGGIVWEGKACCRYCARTEALFAMSEAEGK